MCSPRAEKGDNMSAKRRRSYGLSFSWKRALGVSAAKGRISRATGIPLTKSGRQRKIGRLATKGSGCFSILALGCLALMLVAAIAAR